MRDIKSYERAMRRHGVGESLRKRLDATMQDLNEERPRPVLGGRTARETYENDRVALPDRRAFVGEIGDMARLFRETATSRHQRDRAHRRAVEAVLMRYGLMKIEGDVSHDYPAEVRTN